MKIESKENTKPKEELILRKPSLKHLILRSVGGGGGGGGGD